MGPKKERRQSIAVGNADKVQVPNRKRRAHSIGGALLSPAARRRRSLAPRKSILKASASAPVDEEESPPKYRETDHEVEVSDRTSRMSVGRRVSFAANAQIRLFEKQPQAPSSSPIQGRAPAVSDENAYPGATPRRPSSPRGSMGEGEMSMDVDDDYSEEEAADDIPSLGTAVPGFELIRGPLSVPDDDLPPSEGNEQEDGEAEMEMTDVYNSRRRSSVGRRASLARQSLAGNESVEDDGEAEMELTDVHRRQSSAGRRSSLARKPLTEAGPSSDPGMEDESGDYGDDMSLASEVSEPPVEYQMPIRKSLRPKKRQSEAWLALRAVTGSIDEPFDPDDAITETDEDDTGDLFIQREDDMEIEEGVARLRKLQNLEGQEEDQTEHSFASEDSTTRSNAQGDRGDQTINVTSLIRRQSLAAQKDATATGAAPATSQVAHPPPVPQTPQARSVFSVAPGTAPRAGAVFSAPTPRTGNVFSLPPATSTIPPPRQNISNVAQTPRGSVFSRPAAPQSAIQVVRDVVPTPAKSVFSAPTPGKVFTPKPVGAAPQRRGAPPTVIPTPSTTPSSRIFTRPNSTARPTPRSPSKSKSGPPSSPSKEKPTFSAAFAPPSKPLAKPSPKKRTPPEPAPGDHQPSLPKRVAFAAKEPGSSRDVPVAVPVPSKEVPPRNPKTPSVPPHEPARRASGFLARRKSMATGAGRRMSVIPESASGPVVEPEEPAFVDQGKGREVEQVEELPVIQVISPPRESLYPTLPEAPVTPVVAGLRFDVPAAVEEEQDMTMDEDEDPVRDPSPVNDVQMAPRQEPAPVEEYEQPQEEEEEQMVMSLDDFFTLTKINFMGQMKPVRRSSIHPNQVAPRARRNEDGTPIEIPLAEYAIAMTVDVPRLELYTSLVGEFESVVEESKASIAQMDEDAQKIPPELFFEWLNADDVSRGDIEQHLRLIRGNARLMQKAQWYTWKRTWLQEMFTKAEEGLDGLQADERTLEVIAQETESILPALRDEYAEVLRELESEEAIVDEIKNCNQDYLNELKATISEQNMEVEVLRREVSEGNSTIARLDQQLEELDNDKKSNAAAITGSQRQLDVQKTGAKAEIYRLKAELGLLENIHMWRMITVKSELFVFVYADQFRVSIPCLQLVPIGGRVSITPEPKMRTKVRDQHPHLSAYLLNLAVHHIAQGNHLSVSQIVSRLSNFWFACAQIRQQLRLLLVKFPVSVAAPSSNESLGEGFRVKTTVLFPARKAKAFVTFEFSLETLCGWPMSAGELTCQTKVVYGDVEEAEIQQAVSSRLAEASAEESNACLLESCVNVVDLYV